MKKFTKFSGSSNKAWIDIYQLTRLLHIKYSQKTKKKNQRFFFSNNFFIVKRKNRI